MSVGHREHTRVLVVDTNGGHLGGAVVHAWDHTYLSSFLKWKITGGGCKSLNSNIY